MKHTYLDKYIQKPVIEKDKIILLLLIVQNMDISTGKKRQYILSTMLVQIALDTHDLIAIINNDDENENNLVAKQLSVLAGDYYSGLYYLLLSEMEDFDMIQILASAIKEINEHKMTLYYNEVDSFEHYIQIVKEVDSLLINHVAKTSTKMILKDFASDILITRKLMKERRNIHEQGMTPVLDYWMSHSTKSTYSSIINKIEMFIKEYTKQIESSLIEAVKLSLISESEYHDLLYLLMHDNISTVKEG